MRVLAKPLRVHWVADTRFDFVNAFDDRYGGVRGSVGESIDLVCLADTVRGRAEIRDEVLRDREIGRIAVGTIDAGGDAHAGRQELDVLHGPGNVDRRVDSQ